MKRIYASAVLYSYHRDRIQRELSFRLMKGNSLGDLCKLEKRYCVFWGLEAYWSSFSLPTSQLPCARDLYISSFQWCFGSEFFWFPPAGSCVHIYSQEKLMSLDD